MDALAKKNPVLLMVIANVLMGGNSVLAKIGFESIPPLLFGGMRYFFASLVILFFGWLAIEKYDPKDNASLFVQASLQVLCAVTWFWALTLTQAINVTIIFLLTPIMVYVGSVLFLGEPRSQKALSGSLIAFCGGVLMFGAPVISGGDTDAMIGNGLMLISATSLAFLIIHSKKIITEKNRRTVLGVRWLSAAMAFFILSLAVENPADIQDASTRSLLALVIAAIFAGALGVLLFYKALEHMRAEDSSAIFYIDTLTGTLLSAIVLGEELSDTALIAAGIIIAGVLVAHPVHINRFMYYQKFNLSKFDEFMHWAKKEYSEITHLLKRYI